MSTRDPKRRLADWFRQWRTPLRQFLIGRVSVPTSDLDDIAQEVFLRLMRYERTELIEQPQAYLYKMAANVAAEWSIRMRYARPHDSRWLADLADDSLDAEVHRGQLQREMEQALLGLTARQREVLKLQFFDSLSRAQIAERLGLSERTVKRISVQSYRALRLRLNAESLGGVTHERD